MKVLLHDVIDEKFKEKYETTGRPTYLKVIVTNHVLEVYEYERLPVLPSQKKKEKDSKLELDMTEYDNTVSDRKNNMQKARNRLRRLITANFEFKYI